jgi:hypothetical protein
MNEDQKNRLFSIYQMLLSFSESEEAELFDDRGDPLISITKGI